MVKIIKLSIIFLFILNGCSNQAKDKVIPVPPAIPVLKVYSCDNDSIIITPNAKNA